MDKTKECEVKKVYCTPEIRVVELHQEAPLLCESGYTRGDCEDTGID